MLRWLTRWFRPRPDPREIFHYQDGTRRRSADPIAVWASLSGTLGPEWAELFRVIAAKPVPGLVGEQVAARIKAQQEASRKLADAVCDAFGVEPFADGEGLTIGQRISLARDYLEFMSGLAVPAVPFASSPRPTAPSPPASPTPSSAASSPSATAPAATG